MDALVLPFDKLGKLHDDTDNDVFLNSYVHSSGKGNYSYTVDPKNVYVEGDALVLKVDPPVGNTVGSSQLSSRRQDILYGTFRSAIQMPKESGSCVGFFSYFNDTEEIDIEYIGQNSDMLYLSSKRTNPRDHSMDIDYLNYVYKSGTLSDYHDYRFDWMPGKVDFFVDGKQLYTANRYSPTAASRMMLMNWGNGDVDWSSLPTVPVYARFRNVRMFFNSSHPYVLENFPKACAAAKASGSKDTLCSVLNVPSDVRYGFQENVIRNYAVTGQVGAVSGQTGSPSVANSSTRSRVLSMNLYIWMMGAMIVSMFV